MKKYLALALAAALTHTACEEKQTAPQQPTQEAAAVPEPAEKAGSPIKTVKIGEQVWMAENLNIETEGSVCYQNNPENCGKYGRLYNWQAATKACPIGWHLPSNAEWSKLDIGEESDGKSLKAKSWNGTDQYGFAALPGGRGDSSGDYDNLGERGYWWSSTEDGDRAYLLCIYCNAGQLFLYDTEKENLISIRCIKD